MKYLFSITLIFLLIGCSINNHITYDKKLNGTWIPVKQELAGKELPAALYANYTLIIADSIYKYTELDKEILQFQKGKIDIYGKDGINAGKHYTAIYKIENQQLIICYNLSGDSYPSAFETASNPKFFLSVFKRKNE